MVSGADNGFDTGGAGGEDNGEGVRESVLSDCFSESKFEDIDKGVAGVVEAADGGGVAVEGKRFLAGLAETDLKRVSEHIQR